MSILSRVKTWISGETLTADDLNGEFDNILSNLDPDNVEDASTDATAMQAVADPYPAGSPSLATDLRGELQRLRYVLKQITGETQWYIDPDNTLAALETDMNAAQSAITTAEADIDALEALTNPVDPSNVDDHSANATEMQAVTDPYPGDVVSLATNLDGEIERLRFVVKGITGTTYWYGDPAVTISTLNTRTGAATTSASGISELATGAETYAWTDTGRVITPSGLGAWAKYGYIWLPASCFSPTDTNGATWGLTEYKAGWYEGQYYAFDGATSEHICTVIAMPEQWNLGTVWIRFFWSPGDSACTAGDTVAWKSIFMELSNDDALNFTWDGTTASAIDTVLAGKNADLHVSPNGYMAANDAAVGDLMVVSVYRDVTADDMTEDAWLFGCLLQVALTSSVSVWS